MLHVVDSRDRVSSFHLDFHTTVLFPHVQKATANLVETLGNVRRNNGAGIDLAVVVAYFRSDALSDKDAEAVVNFVAFDIDEENSPLGHTDNALDFDITVIVIAGSDSDVNCHDRALAAAAEVEKALLADVFRGGLAQNTELIGGDVIDQREQGWYGLRMNWRVTVRYPINEPFPTT